jgi:hypothetical protein
VSAPVPFIVCHPRSGSTILRLMLDAHPEMSIPPETHFCGLFASEAAAKPLSPRTRREILEHITTSLRWHDFRLAASELSDCLNRLPDGTLPGEALAAFWRLYAERRGKPRWGDKTPGHILCVADIARVFPDARFIHIVRDARDVAASMRQIWFGKGRSLIDLTTDWVNRISLFYAAVSRLGLPAHTVRYEDLVTDPVAQLQAVCEFIRLPYVDSLLDYRRTAEYRLMELADLRIGDCIVAGADRIATHAMALEPLDKRQIARWRTALDDREIAVCERVAGEMLVKLGYPLSSHL